MIWVSYSLIVLEIGSALMLYGIVEARHEAIKRVFGLRRWEAFVGRVIVSGLIVGLAIHALGQIELVFNYREPRTWAWLPYTLFLNLLIWSAWIAVTRDKWRRWRRKDG